MSIYDDSFEPYLYDDLLDFGDSWSPEEDNRLLGEVRTHTAQTMEANEAVWDRVALNLHRTKEECEMRYLHLIASTSRASTSAASPMRSQHSSSQLQPPSRRDPPRPTHSSRASRAPHGSVAVMHSPRYNNGEYMETSAGLQQEQLELVTQISPRGAASSHYNRPPPHNSHRQLPANSEYDDDYQSPNIEDTMQKIAAIDEANLRFLTSTFSDPRITMLLSALASSTPINLASFRNLSPAVNEQQQHRSLPRLPPHHSSSSSEASSFGPLLSSTSLESRVAAESVVALQHQSGGSVGFLHAPSQQSQQQQPYGGGASQVLANTTLRATSPRGSLLPSGHNNNSMIYDHFLPSGAGAISPRQQHSIAPVAPSINYRVRAAASTAHPHHHTGVVPATGSQHQHPSEPHRFTFEGIAMNNGSNNTEAYPLRQQQQLHHPSHQMYASASHAQTTRAGHPTSPVVEDASSPRSEASERNLGRQHAGMLMPTYFRDGEAVVAATATGGGEEVGVFSDSDSGYEDSITVLAAGAAGGSIPHQGSTGEAGGGGYNPHIQHQSYTGQSVYSGAGGDGGAGVNSAASSSTLGKRQRGVMSMPQTQSNNMDAPVSSMSTASHKAMRHNVASSPRSSPRPPIVPPLPLGNNAPPAYPAVAGGGGPLQYRIPHSQSLAAAASSSSAHSTPLMAAQQNLPMASAGIDPRVLGGGERHHDLAQHVHYNTSNSNNSFSTAAHQAAFQGASSGAVENANPLLSSPSMSNANPLLSSPSMSSKVSGDDDEDTEEGFVGDIIYGQDGRSYRLFRGNGGDEQQLRGGHNNIPLVVPYQPSARSHPPSNSLHTTKSPHVHDDSSVHSSASLAARQPAPLHYTPALASQQYVHGDAGHPQDHATSSSLPTRQQPPYQPLLLPPPPLPLTTAAHHHNGQQYSSMPATADHGGNHQPHVGVAISSTSTQLPQQQHSSSVPMTSVAGGMPLQPAAGPSLPPNNSTNVQHVVNSRRVTAAAVSDPHHIVNSNMRPAPSADRLDEYLVQMVDEIWQEQPQDDDSSESSPRPPPPLTAAHHLRQHRQHATHHHHHQQQSAVAASSYSVAHSVSGSTTATGAAAADDYFMAPEDSDEAELGYEVDYGDVRGSAYGDDDVLESSRRHQAALAAAAAASDSIADTFYGAVAALDAMDGVGGHEANRALRERIIADATAGAERLSAREDGDSEEEQQEKVTTIRKVPAAAPTTRGEKSLAVTCERFISVCEMFQSTDSDITLSLSPKQSTRTAMNSPLNGAPLDGYGGGENIINRTSNCRKRMNVEAVSKAMDVPLRRIYDLLSILEVLSLVSYEKGSRGNFIWYGAENLPIALGYIQAEAVIRYPAEARRNGLQLSSRTIPITQAVPQTAPPSRLDSTSSANEIPVAVSHSMPPPSAPPVNIGAATAAATAAASQASKPAKKSSSKKSGGGMNGLLDMLRIAATTGVHSFEGTDGAGASAAAGGVNATGSDVATSDWSSSTRTAGTIPIGGRKQSQGAPRASVAVSWASASSAAPDIAVASTHEPPFAPAAGAAAGAAAAGGGGGGSAHCYSNVANNTNADTVPEGGGATQRLSATGTAAVGDSNSNPNPTQQGVTGTMISSLACRRAAAEGVSLTELYINFDREDRSLVESLCRGFLALFLLGNESLTMQTIVTEIFPDEQDYSRPTKKNATKIRRLYDVGNVLCCLGIIEKFKIERLGKKKSPSDGPIQRGFTWCWSKYSPRELRAMFLSLEREGSLPPEPRLRHHSYVNDVVPVTK